MPDGGKCIIKTEDCELDENFATMHPGAEPGESVMTAFSDIGIEFTQEMTTRIFEPFFTTK